MTGPWWWRRVGLLTAMLVGFVVLSPWWWGTGYMLHYDLVFVPHLPLSTGTAGLDGGVPRAVPNDVVVALLGLVAPGWLVERLVLLGFFVLIGAGVDRWSVSPVARVASAVALCWNPWVGERLAIGHWGYLWGYAALVWVVVSLLGWRASTAPEPRRRHLFGAGGGLAVGALSGSTGGVLVGGAALVLGAWPGPRRLPTRTLLLGAGWWVLLDAAWWFPFLMLAPSGVADPRGVSAFASRADSPAGLAASLLSGGGIWHQASWFASRGNGVVVVLIALAAVGCVGVVLRRTRSTSGWSVVVLGVLGLVVAGLGGTAGTQSLLTWIVVHVPGGGLLRDGQKFAAWWVVPAGLGVGVLVDGVRRRAAGTVLAPMTALAAVVVPVATLPTLAFAEQGRWTQAHYPREVTDVAAMLSERPGVVAVFPWQLYRRYAWNDHQVVLDPWQRLLSSRVLVDDDLPLSDGVVRGESSTSHAVTQALRSGDDARAVRVLRAARVRYLVEQKDQPAGAGRAPASGTVVHDGPLLQVRDLGPTSAEHVAWWAPAGLVATGAALLAPLVGFVRRPRAGRRHASR